jgi:hypothetical protein
MSSISSNVETQINSLIQNMPNPTSITSDLNTLQEQYGPVLDDFKKYYVLHNQYPDLNEYTQMFSSIKGNLQTLNSNIFTLTNNIENSTQQQNNVMKQVNEDIKQEKLIHTMLLQKLNIVKNEMNGAREMSKNYTSMYNLQFFSNITIFLGIVIVGTVIYKVYKKRYLPNQ